MPLKDFFRCRTPVAGEEIPVSAFCCQSVFPGILVNLQMNRTYLTLQKCKNHTNRRIEPAIPNQSTFKQNNRFFCMRDHAYTLLFLFINETPGL